MGLARCVELYARPHWTVHLRPLLSAGREEIRAHAVTGLGAVAAQSGPWFRPMLDDADASVRLAAVNAFETLRAVGAPRPHRCVRGTLDKDSDEAVQQAALAALAT